MPLSQVTVGAIVGSGVGLAVVGTGDGGGVAIVGTGEGSGVGHAVPVGDT